jgi:hypothetical protein
MKTKIGDATKPGVSNWCGESTFGPPRKVDNIDENVIYMIKPSGEKAKSRTVDSETYEKINTLLQTTDKEEVK